jgi:hypothetical protein
LELFNAEQSEARVAYDLKAPVSDGLSLRAAAELAPFAASYAKIDTTQRGVLDK